MKFKRIPLNNPHPRISGKCLLATFRCLWISLKFQATGGVITINLYSKELGFQCLHYSRVFFP